MRVKIDQPLKVIFLYFLQKQLFLQEIKSWKDFALGSSLKKALYRVSTRNNMSGISSLIIPSLPNLNSWTIYWIKPKNFGH